MLLRTPRMTSTASPSRPRRTCAGSTRRALAVGMVQQRVIHGRDALEERDPVALDDLERLDRIEAREHRQARAVVDRRVQAAGLAERVEQRQRAEDHVLRRRCACSSVLPLGVLEHVRVGQLGALGRARSCRRCRGSPRCPSPSRWTSSGSPARPPAGARTRPASRRSPRPPPRRRLGSASTQRTRARRTSASPRSPTR